MFARILEVTLKTDKKEDFINAVRNEVLPILRKQPGFLELLPFNPEIKNEKFVVISLWNEKVHADKYVRAAFPKVEQTVKPYLAEPITFRTYMVETTLCEHFVDALTQTA